MIIRLNAHRECIRAFMEEETQRMDEDIQWDITYRPISNVNVIHALRCPDSPLNKKPEPKKSTGPLGLEF